MNKIRILIIDTDESSLSRDLKQSLEKINNIDLVSLISLRWQSNKYSIGLLSRWFKTVIRSLKYDTVIVFSPLVVSLPIIILSKINPKIRIIGLYFDFFPIHQMEIGKNIPIPNFFYHIEKFLFKKLDLIGLMSTRNIEFAKKYFKLNDSSRLIEVPLWNIEITEPYTMIDSNDRINLFFGGQLTFGRNLEFLIETIRFFEKNCRIHHHFHIFGLGPLHHLFQSLQTELSNVTYHGKLNEKEYLSKIKKMQVGIIMTNPDVTIPSYPSKSLNLLRLGIPILGVSEISSDFGDFINSNKCGLILNHNNSTSLLENFEKLSKNLEEYSSNGHKLYNKRHFHTNALKNLKEHILCH